jgi:hypothetical protein
VRYRQPCSGDEQCQRNADCASPERDPSDVDPMIGRNSRWNDDEEDDTRADHQR